MVYGAAEETAARNAVQQRAQAEAERTEEAFFVERKASEEQAIRQQAKQSGYGAELTEAVVKGYNQSSRTMDAGQYMEAVGKAYEYGKSGFSQSAAQKAAQGISQDVTKAAWTAGKEQANEKATGKQSANDGGKRNAGVDSGKQTRTVAKDTGATKQKSAEIERAKTNLSRQNRVRDTGTPYLSGKEIGLSRGAERRSFREAPESTWDAEMKNAAETLRRAGFENVHFVVGSIGVTNQKANVTRYVDGAMVGDAVWVNATAKKFTVTQLANHEAFHRAIQDAPYLQDSVLAELTDQLGESGIQELAQKYAEAYEGCYDAENMEAYIEEICADAYADMDRFPDVKEKLIQKAAERAQKAAQETEESGGQRAPPEERYSASKDFGADVQEWHEEGMPAGESFVLGTTGETLQGLGAIESDIYMNGDKIRTILKEHPEMTIREIQKIPELLDDPVLILKSQNVGRGGNPNSRLVIFGTVKAQNGQPVLSVLDLRPRERGFVIDDMQKVTSAYTKDNPTAFVTNSDVLFADRKRTIPLLRRFGLTIASRELLRDGPVGSISYSGSDVKLNGIPFSSIVSTRNDASEKFSAAEENAEAETQYTLDSIPKKAQTYLMRSLNQTAAQIQNTLSLPFAARQEVLKPALETMMNEYLQTGRISQETMDKAFEDSYEKGVELDTEFYDQYKDVKKWMQTTAVTLSEADRADIADFNAFRKEAFGRLRITNEGGTPVDTAYMELQQQAPELFPVGITQPADQLMRMFEVSRSIEKVQRSLDEYHGQNAAEFKRWAKNDYETSVEGMLGSLRVARRYAEARMPDTGDENTVFAEDVGASMEVKEASDGSQYVMVGNPMTNAQLSDHQTIANYIAAHIGEAYTIIESGQKVYIGEKLPEEYTQSRYTQHILKSNVIKAKNKAVSNLGEMIEIATNRRWEKTRHPGSKDAKYGMYRYDTTFAFPVQGGQSYKAYDAELVIRNASDGKKYLYDIVSIKENAGIVFDLNKKVRGRQKYAATQSSVSTDSIRTNEQKSQEKFSAAEENAEAETQYTLDSIPKKAQTYLMRSLNQTAAQLQNTLSLPFAARKEQSRRITMERRRSSIWTKQKPLLCIREQGSQCPRCLTRTMALWLVYAEKVRLPSRNFKMLQNRNNSNAGLETGRTIRNRRSVQRVFADGENGHMDISSKNICRLGYGYLFLLQNSFCMVL